MALSLCVLGSGSAGNCTVVVLEDARAPRFLLIDAGLAPRTTAKRLEPLGIELEQIERVCVTHFDADHFHAGWEKVIGRQGLTVHAHRRHRRRALASGVPVRRLDLFDDGLRLEGGTRIDGALLAHDDLGTVGYVIEHGGARLGYATDLGRVPDSLPDHFRRLHALAIESNYDAALQRASDRPDFLKERIMGGLGHLSNEQALAAVGRIARTSRLSHLVLLHLSRQCNDPRLVKRLYAAEAGDLLDKLTITSQTRPTPLLHVPGPRRRRRRPRVGEQLQMFAGSSGA
ncbi:MAG: MBL fold metallo-hydrolase [Planctomycetota bacterium]|jgi:phosphoribosyl 1,2-cyclic phosphodiesterase